jgi:hypothetical protein
MKITDPIARPIPTQLTSVIAADQALDGLEAHVRGEQEELDGHELLRSLLGGVREQAVTAEARQMMITLAKPSIAESSPKPTSAMELATIPAAIATAPSTVIHARDSHDSSFTRRARR